jgi:uncharacterized repeat protein (TIGR01451 family)
VNGSTDYLEDASGRIVALAGDPNQPNVLYLAAAGGGVWKTPDGGTTWVPTTDGQPTLFMGALAVAPSSPNILYAGTGEANMGFSKAREFRDNIYYGRGVLKSSDAGETWTLLGASSFDRRTISRIVISPVDPQTVYAAVGALATNGLFGNTGIWKTIDGGLTWANTTTSISATAAFSDLVMDPANPSTLYAAVGQPAGDPGNGVYKTVDGATTWAPAGNFGTGAIDPIIGRIALAVAPSAPQTLYAAIARSQPSPPSCSAACAYKMLKSANGGTTWAPVTTPRSICISGNSFVGYMASAGDYHNALAVDPSDANTVYAGGICLVMSSDGGNSWSAMAQGETDGPHRDHHALAFDASGRLLDGNDGGVWRLEDPSAPVWSNLNGNLQITQLIGLALHPIDSSTAYAGTQDTGTMRFQGAAQWPRALRGDGGATELSTASPNRVYQVTRISASSPSIFRRSDDAGATWSIKVSGICTSDSMNFYPPVALDPANSDRLLLGAARYQLATGEMLLRVYQTTDGGNSWSVLGAPGATCPVADSSQIVQVTNMDTVAVAPSDPNTVYASTAGHIFVTTDHGVTWQIRDVLGVGEPHFRRLLVDPVDAQTAYAVRDRFGGPHVFRTTTAGVAWADISGDLLDLPANVIVADTRTVPPTLFVGTDNGVYQTSDLGGHWSRYGAGLPHAQIAELRLNQSSDVLAAATHGRGMWEIPLGASATCCTSARSAQASALISGSSTAPVTYTLEIRNSVPASADGVVLVAPLPPGTQLVQATPSQGMCRTVARTIECKLGELRAQRSASVQVVLRVVAGGKLTTLRPGHATVSGGEGGQAGQLLVSLRR